MTAVSPPSAFGDERAMLREMVRRFAREEVAPLAYEIDRDERFPIESWRRGAELGLLGITAPEQYGGAGLGLTEVCIVTEELAKVCMSTCATLMHQADLVVDNLVRNATADQQARWLPGLCSGEIVGCLAMTEPEAGSDVLSMRTRAIRTKAGWTLSGSKTFITNGPNADVALVYAKTGDHSKPRSLGLFLVPAESPGFTKGKKFEKMGWRGSPTGELIFDDVELRDESLVGREGNGLHVLMSGLNSERLVMAAQGVGLAQGALDAALQYASERRQFGRRISEFQAIQHKLATMYAEIETSRALLYQSTALADDGRVGELNLPAAAAKLQASEVAMRSATQAVQIFGGYGYIKEFPVERYMRDAKLLEIGGGTSEIQRHIIAKALLHGRMG